MKIAQFVMQNSEEKDAPKIILHDSTLKLIFY